MYEFSEPACPYRHGPPQPRTETRAYRDRRKTDGLSHREIVRCLKRYLARQLYPILLKDLTALT